jgi:hypothetical protein
MTENEKKREEEEARLRKEAKNRKKRNEALDLGAESPPKHLPPDRVKLGLPTVEEAKVRHSAYIMPSPKIERPLVAGLHEPPGHLNISLQEQLRTI